ncbi:MAG: sialate O-acetylesterase [Lachnospiraceae bacterium]|nr:sialate O-acetylesterase [Lachnospiraceae bacterium]MDY4428633.1 sialate O-acetylesterase [Lachnospiraceae bacterium]MDY5216743.1 sialate O-acetylesterase [Lachnospiraceae bacterium]
MKRILSLALLITMTISLCACNDERVVYPVEVVKPEKTLEEDTETKDSEAAEEKTEEKADDESDVDVPSEEFVLLEDDEEEEGPDESGTIVTHDGKPVIDLIFFMGQSNMSGAGGDKELAPPVTEGHGYEFRAISDPTRLYNIEEPFGKNESFIGGICDIPGAKKGSIVSCFANEYYALTGVPIVGVSASQGATTTEIWQSAGFQIDMQQRYDITVNWLNDNGYYIRNRYVVWFQGESDAANHVQPEIYNTNMDNIIRPLFIKGLNKVFIITPGRTLSIKNYFDDIINQQLDMCRESGYYALGTNILSDVSAEYMVDEWHYNQLVLNIIGIETAKSVACYTLNRKERIDYDYENDRVYIPNGFDYTGEESVEPLDLSNLQKLQDEYWEDYLVRINEKNNG